MGTDLAKLEKNLDLVEQWAAEVRPMFHAVQDQPTMLQALAVSTAMDKMRNALDAEVLKHIKALENSALGFMTDKPDGGYPIHVIRDVMIEAAMHGLFPVNNEFNIIAGRFYPAKAGLRRRLKSHPGLSDLNIEIGVPEVHESGALVPMRATWKLDGVEQSMDCWENESRIPVRRNKQMGIDGLLGKAERKLYARILDRVTGMSFSRDDELADAAIDVTPVPTTPPPQLSAPSISKDGEFAFSGIGDNAFLDKLKDAKTLMQVAAVSKEYLPQCETDEDRMFVVESCTSRARTIGTPADTSNKE